MRKIVALVIVTTLFFFGCLIPKAKRIGEPVTEKVANIKFEVAKNYFVRNDMGELSAPKIETEEAFSQIFGMATTMGEAGKPTSIDFTKQYVIAVLLPETNAATTISPVSLQKNKAGEIVFTYKVETGAEQSYTTRPNLAIVVDKANDGKVVLKAE